MPPEVTESQSSIEPSSPPRGVGSTTQASSLSSPKSSRHTPSVSHLPLLSYKPLPARHFTSEEIRDGRGRLTRQAYVHGLVEHPAGAIVEYPESGATQGLGIAHVFHVDLNSDHFTNPRSNSQYSLGEPQGAHHNVACHQLRDPETDKPILCLQRTSRCNYFASFYLLLLC